MRRFASSSRIEAYAGSRVALGHFLSSIRIECTRCAEGAHARMDLRRGHGLDRWPPNASTANDPMADP